MTDLRPRTAFVKVKITMVCGDDLTFEEDAFAQVGQLLEIGGGDEFDAEPVEVIEVVDADEGDGDHE